MRKYGYTQAQTANCAIPYADFGRIAREEGIQIIGTHLILEAAEKNGVKYYVVEQDGGYAVNCFQSIKSSADYLRRYMK